MKTTFSRPGRGLALLALIAVLAACSPRQMIMSGMADELASQGAAPEEDLGLARDAGAFYLKLSESLLRDMPGKLNLAEAVAGGFTQYAYAFVASEAERIEEKDAKAAQKLRERAARLYRRAQRHAMAALEATSPGFAQALAASDPARWPALRDEQVGTAYWAAAAWGAYISLSKDDPDAVADLPLAVRLAQLAWARRPDYNAGALASLMGSFEAARPGGSPRRATEYFDRAIELAQGRSAAPYVAKAESIALAAGDRAAFESLLRQALAAAAQRRDLQNAAMAERAAWLLGRADDLF